MPHAGKSDASRWEGVKLQVAEETDSETIIEVAVTGTDTGDGKSVLPMLDRVEGALR